MTNETTAPALAARGASFSVGQAKLVVSQTGAAGGTRLARCADEITLAEVYRAVSCGEVFALHHRGPNRDCPVGRNIESVLCNLQKEIDKSINQTLSRYTLQSVIDSVEKGEVPAKARS